MRVIITGSLSLFDELDIWIDDGVALVDQAVEASGFIVEEVLQGGCRGPETWGREWAIRHTVPYVTFPIHHNERAHYGSRVEPMRNRRMIQYAAAYGLPRSGSGLISLWDGRHTGLSGIVADAEACGLRVHVEHLKGMFE